MTTLTATPDLAARTVALAVTAAPAGPLEIWRTDANGRRRVRLPRGATPDSGAYTVTDHEAALTGPVTYELPGPSTNMLPNPSFETNTTGWFRSDSLVVTIASDPAQAYDGAASCRMDTTTAGYISSSPTAVPAEPGQTWAGAAFVKGTGQADLSVVYTDGSSTLATVRAGIVPASSGWAELDSAGVAPAGTTNVRLRVYQEDAAARTLYVDAADLALTALASAATTLGDAGRASDVWIHAAAYPTELPTVSGGIVVGWRPTRSTGAQLVEVIGRADPIDTGPALARTRAHSIEVRCDDLAAALELEALVMAARTVVVRSTTPGLDSTLTVETIDGPNPDPANPRRWRVILAGRETLTGPYLAEAV